MAKNFGTTAGSVMRNELITIGKFLDEQCCVSRASNLLNALKFIALLLKNSNPITREYIATN